MIFQTYLWSSVCLFASGVANTISGIFLYGIVGAVFNTAAALVLTYVVLPTFVFMNLRKVQMSETEREQVNSIFLKISFI